MKGVFQHFDYGVQQIPEPEFISVVREIRHSDRNMCLGRPIGELVDDGALTSNGNMRSRLQKRYMGDLQMTKWMLRLTRARNSMYTFILLG
jgi:hypothetical protein